jgi:hypothetical protein
MCARVGDRKNGYPNPIEPIVGVANNPARERDAPPSRSVNSRIKV